VSVLVLLALLTAGGAVTFAGIRRRRDGEPDAAAAPSQAMSGAAGPSVPAPSRDGSGRFSRATEGTNRSRATAMVASAQKPAGGGPRVGGDPPAPAAAAVPPAGDPSPVADPAPEGSPPDRRLAWTAEIEWRHSDGESRFCVIARGPGTVTLARSAPLEWPPTGPAGVQAMTDAAEKLAATLAAAGWKALPPGHSWYGKRFVWEPVGAERTQATPVKSKSRTVAPLKPAGQAAARSDEGVPHPLRRRRLRLALLCVVVVLGPLAALLLRSGDDDRRAASPATQATATPAQKPSSPGIDLTVPVLVLLGLVPLVLLIRETRGGGRQ
jgi:hypothetical protein